MDIRLIKDVLNRTASDMMELAGKLSDKGERKLEAYELDLIRTACVPAVKEQLDIALMNYMTGRPISIDLKHYEL